MGAIGSGIALIWKLMKALPGAISLGSAILDAWNSAKAAYERRKKLSELAKATEKAQQTGDTSDVENLFRNGPGAGSK